MSDASAISLLRQCEEARGAGRDFPTSWSTILKRHPLVNGLPGHEIREREALIVVHLLTGQRLASGRQGFFLL
ncbi:MAG: hypothetical protein A4S17_00710 [Proteobacteria bacterium HN_bin10]|nr:MAG: hypothetical protein A4S17_00710 [Proteobacteria bacterium HN_bin10]